MSELQHPVTSTQTSESFTTGEETWRTRPETNAAFAGNLLLCTLFGFFLLWYVPKYVMRHEYVKAILCLVAPFIAAAIVAVLIA